MSRPPPGPRLHPAHWPLGASGLAGQLLALLVLLALRALSAADCPCQEPKLCLPISHHPDYEVSATSSLRVLLSWPEEKNSVQRGGVGAVMSFKFRGAAS